ncbi:uncharacterized protein LOC109859739 [Pseudomyrmex gracilis]|uniref:uncharacterized protein LOC109859739 n=1 Tax=Pseudomyrmex gracilis TaxID=219809 RepID=UPI000995C462|nr:uncharacterized protein LOC109859739 [Pseudomyrmex gracilis]XP_020293864.1 uncharacterized protein LOC109859739 [Pseudomyrmex gracilis]
MTTEVSEDHAKSKVSEREHIRQTFYKNPITKDNLRLDLDWNSYQKKTRQYIIRNYMLNHQKKCRDENFNAARGILSYSIIYEDRIEDYEKNEAYEYHKCYEDLEKITKHVDSKKSERNLHENNTGIHRQKKDPIRTDPLSTVVQQLGCVQLNEIPIAGNTEIEMQE